MREENQRRYAIDDDQRSSNCIWRHWNLLTSLLAIVCTAGVWGMAVTIVDGHKNIGIYLMFKPFNNNHQWNRFCGIIITFLEISFILEKLFGCCSEESLARRCWLIILAIDNWKRGLLYLVLSIVCYVNPKESWQVLVAGALMDLCGLLYFLKTVRARKQTEPYKYKQLSVS